VVHVEPAAGRPRNSGRSRCPASSPAQAGRDRGQRTPARRSAGALEAYPRLSGRGGPQHAVEHRGPAGRRAAQFPVAAGGELADQFRRGATLRGRRVEAGWRCTRIPPPGRAGSASWRTGGTRPGRRRSAGDGRAGLARSVWTTARRSGTSPTRPPGRPVPRATARPWRDIEVQPGRHRRIAAVDENPRRSTCARFSTGKVPCWPSPGTGAGRGPGVGPRSAQDGVNPGRHRSGPGTQVGLWDTNTMTALPSITGQPSNGRPGRFAISADGHTARRSRGPQGGPWSCGNVAPSTG